MNARRGCFADSDQALIARVRSPERPSLRAIGAEFGISGESVRRIAKRHGVSTADLPPRPARPRPGAEAFAAAVRAQPRRTTAAIGADFGLRPAAAQRAAVAAGVFRHGQKPATLARDAEILRRFREGRKRPELAMEFGLSLGHIHYILQVARRSQGS